jgi:alpha-L-arabinofuranosidase
MTEPGGPAWRQTIFFPFAITARLARSTFLRLVIESPTYDTAEYGSAPLVDAVASINDDGAVSVFLVNRSQDAATIVSIDIGSLGAARLAESSTLADDDPNATNTLEQPNRVAPSPNQSARIDDNVLTVELPPISWTALRLIPGV